MSRYRAIFFDLDGTAIPNREDGRPSARVLQAISTYRDHTYLIPTTGRTLIQGLPVVRELGVTGLCIFGGGTIIYDLVQSKVLQRTTLPPEAVRAVIDIASDNPDRPLYIREERLGPDPHTSHAHLIDDTELMMIGGVPDEAIPELGARLHAIPHVAASIARSWYGGHVFNITHENATKEHAVTSILELLGIPAKNSIGIGDGGNDLHLFRSVGLKIAMGNAYPELKAAADEIAPSVDDDGLADMIEKYA